MIEPTNSPENRAKLADAVINSMTVEEMKEFIFQDLYELYRDDDIFDNTWEDYLTEEDLEV